MSGTEDKIKGAVKETVGSAKQGIGKATDNDRLVGEGVIQEKEGEAQSLIGKAKDAASEAVGKAKDMLDGKR